METQKKSLGRKKIKMAKMENDSNLQVTFSKRRSGLFKKGSELCTLCGAEVGIIVFSPGKKVFSFGHPDIGYIVDRYLNGNPPENSGTMQLIGAHRNANVHQLNMELTQLNNQLEAEKRRSEELNQMRRAAASQNQNWWEAPVNQLNLPQLQQLKSALEELKKNVVQQADKLLVQTTNGGQQFYMGSSSTGVVFPNYEMLPQNYNGLDMNMIPSGGFNPINPEAYNMNHPQGFNPGPPDFGHGFF